VPAKSVDRFRGCKLYPTQNVLAVVDFDLHTAGWEGSAHDSLVLQDALSRPNGLKIPKGIHGFSKFLHSLNVITTH
jgi:hypothetical protein